MTCVHLRKLYDLCQSNNLRLASSDLVHVVCKECGQKEVCPSVLVEEYEWEADQHSTKAAAKPQETPEA